MPNIDMVLGVEWDKLSLVIIDKALIGILLLVIGLWINRKLHEYKVNLDENVNTRVRIAEKRLPSYRKLWELTQPTTRARETDLCMYERKALYNELCNWYYEEGNGIFLSETTRELYLSAREDLLKDSITNDDITRIFSSLRTAIKNEIGIYG